MAYYRLEFLDSEKHVLRAQAMDCANDAVAEALAEAEAGSLALELWDYDRCVRRFEACAEVTVIGLRELLRRECPHTARRPGA
jgi:hypothetical protein